MPTYEYECATCGSRFERRQSMSDEPVRTCPDCAGPVRRVLFPVGIVFKGSGFYVTDNPRSNGKNGNPSADQGSDKPESTSPKAEGKPAEGKSAESKPAETKAADKKSTAETKV